MNFCNKFLLILKLQTFFLLVSSHDDDFGGEVYVPPYTPPIPPANSYFVETFQSEEEFNKNWIKSSAKKEHTDDEISLYDGEWKLEEPVDAVIKKDVGLVLKSKAKHHAISSKLRQPFIFDGQTFVVQFEAKFQRGLDCGGAYIKLLNHSDDLNLEDFTDRTPYVIMFGPDKCGNDVKLHFIFRHKNPLTEKYEEKHGPKAPAAILYEAYRDKLTHLYTLVIHSNNSFYTMIDDVVVTSGSLLHDVSPPVNPSEEIVDVNDVKPQDWDDRLKVPDANAVKPESWDETAPEMIPDPNAKLPDGWLVEEEEWIPDDRAIKPKDWDDELDGTWEPPLILNPVCETALGCGPWTPPLINNPKFKGPWSAPLINNPNYQGPWLPRKILNPKYFYDPLPYNMSSIGAVGLELWSMQPDILFDNFIIASSARDVRAWSLQTWKHKHDLEFSKVKKDKMSVVEAIITAANENPWLWVVIIFVIAFITLIFIIFCCQPPQRADSDVIKNNKRKMNDLKRSSPSSSSSSVHSNVTSSSKFSRDNLLSGDGQVWMRTAAASASTSHLRK